MDDAELLLLSWAQMVASELIVPDTKVQAAKADLEERLLSEFDVHNISLISRSVDEYRVAYVRGEETKSISFEADEVESIYDQ